MKIIHLSDLHIGWIDKKTKQSTIDRFDKIINRITSQFKPVKDYIIIITGDIVNNANKPGLYQKAKKQIDILIKAGFAVLVIPGNHDYGTGSLGNLKFVNLFKEVFYNDIDTEYPKIDLIKNILFIGLDSTADELHRYDALFAEGELGKKQLAKLKEIINNKKYSKYKKILYLHHHPFHPRPGHQLKDSKKLKEIISGKIDVLLFGHNHNGYNLSNYWGINRCYDAGSSTRKNNSQSSLRIIDLEKNSDHDFNIEVITESDLLI